MRKSPNRENGDFLQVKLVAALKKNADALFPVGLNRLEPPRCRSFRKVNPTPQIKV
jgi:hypothetical protein